ncbi:MAG: VOC family protein [Frankia sp.]
MTVPQRYGHHDDQIHRNPAEHPEGGICWVDLGTPDIDTATTFYRNLFGWTFADPDPTGYRLAGLRGHLVTALGPATEPGPPYWTVYVLTHDIEASVTAATTSGATIAVPPAPAGDAGRSAVVRDPTGAPLSFWQPGSHTGTYASGEHGTLAHAEFTTKRPEQVRHFFRETLQWDLDPTRSAVTRGEHTVATWMPNPSAGATLSSPWLVAFVAYDVGTTRRAALALGATPTERPNVLLDPTGARFGLTSVAETVGAPRERMG